MKKVDDDPTRPMKFAYADPPYLGCAAYYLEYHSGALAWNDIETHKELIKKLCDEYADGWAMSLNSTNLWDILPLCPNDVRIMAWVKPFASFKNDRSTAYAWEPVIVRGGRRRPRTESTVRDWLSYPVQPRKGEKVLMGAKPPAFAYWILDILNVKSGDIFDDLFPGSGVIGRCASIRINNNTPIELSLL